MKVTNEYMNWNRFKNRYILNLEKDGDVKREARKLKFTLASLIASFLFGTYVAP